MSLVTGSMARVQSRLPLCAACCLLALVGLAGPGHAQPGRGPSPGRRLGRGRIARPSSSIVRAEDAGRRTHTNHLIFVPADLDDGITPYALSATPLGLTPAELWAAYGVPNPPSATASAGSGVIAIVDAYDYPTALSDFNAFSQQFGLPPETGSGAVFQVVYASGAQPAADTSWSQEAALDIEWAHAMAPAARIVLVEAASASNADLLAGVDAASRIPGVHEVSVSWGGNEFPSETSYDSHFATPGVVYFAASGDVGGEMCWPAASPNVVSVGGTTLTLDDTGAFVSETGWSDSGGGASVSETRPSYQDALSALSSRGVPDTCLEADPNTGAAVYWQGGWLVIGGTSLATPCVAGLTNLAASVTGAGFASGSSDELTNRIYAHLGDTSPSPTLGSSYYFRDIVSGAAGGNTCASGWDLVTGLGSPWGLHNATSVPPPPPAPVAGFSGTPTSGTAPLAVQFTDSSTNSPTAWSWDFGDGAASAVQNPSHTYTAAGTYTVSLTAINAGGSNTATKAGCVSVTAPSSPPPAPVPTAGFSASPTDGAAPLTVAFTDTSAGGPTSWSWSFGDGGTASVQNPSHTYAAPGTYTVSLTAANASGSNTATKSNCITVSAPPTSPPSAPTPVASFTATPTAGAAPLTVAFSDTSTNSPTSWQWDFGDGGTSTQQNPTHVYPKAGRYTVSLTVANADGSDTKTEAAAVTVTPSDVAADSWAAQAILACLQAGIVTGYPDGSYAPTGQVTRDQMAVFISRALAGGGAKVPAGPAAADFQDVPTDSWAYKYIEYAKSRGIVSGYPGGMYGPTLPVDRGSMAVYIARATANPVGDAGLSGYAPPSAPSFPDVPTDFWAYKYIEYAKSKGIVSGYPDGTYQPATIVTRDQMAVYIARAFGLE